MRKFRSFDNGTGKMFEDDSTECPPFPPHPSPSPSPFPLLLSFSSLPPFLSPFAPLPSVSLSSFPSRSLPVPLNPARGSGERCKLPQRLKQIVAIWQYVKICRSLCWHDFIIDSLILWTAYRPNIAAAVVAHKSVLMITNFTQRAVAYVTQQNGLLLCCLELHSLIRKIRNHFNKNLAIAMSARQLRTQYAEGIWPGA